MFVHVRKKNLLGKQLRSRINERKKWFIQVTHQNTESSIDGQRREEKRSDFGADFQKDVPSESQEHLR